MQLVSALYASIIANRIRCIVNHIGNGQFSHAHKLLNHMIFNMQSCVSKPSGRLSESSSRHSNIHNQEMLLSKLFCTCAYLNQQNPFMAYELAASIYTDIRHMKIIHEDQMQKNKDVIHFEDLPPIVKSVIAEYVC